MDQSSLHNYGCMAFRNANFETEILPKISHYLKMHFSENKIKIIDEALEPKYIKKVVEFLYSNEESFCKLSDLFRGNFKFFFCYSYDEVRYYSFFKEF